MLSSDVAVQTSLLFFLTFSNPVVLFCLALASVLLTRPKMLIPFIGGVGVGVVVCVCVTRQLGLDDNRDMYNIVLSFGTPIETWNTERKKKKYTNTKQTVQYLDLLITRSYTVLPGITSSKDMFILYYNRLHCRLDISRQSSDLFDICESKKEKKKKQSLPSEIPIFTSNSPT